jgi:signal transduction histidine kinase
MFEKRLRRWARDAPAVTIVTLAAIVSVLLLTQDRSDRGELLRSSQLVTYPLVLGAAVFVYFHWRMSSAAQDRATRARLAGWLTVGLVVASLHGVVQATLLSRDAAGHRNDWLIVGQVVVLVVLILITQAAARTEVPGDPAFVGVVVGLLLAVGTCGVLAFAPPLVVSPTSERVLATLALVTGLILAWAVLHQTEVTLWVRHRLALSAVLVTSAQFVRSAEIDARAVVGMAVVAGLLGAAVVCTMTHVLFRRSVVAHQREVQQLQETLAQVRSTVLEERELLHEVGSTVAGIATASHVMRQAPVLSPQRRARLEHMVEAELARLNRLVGSRAPSPAVEFEVDEVVEQLVTSHQERGLDVCWQPCHARAKGNPDAFAEVVNILLENAGRHGRGAVRLDLSASGEDVELVCSDDGPGIAEEVRGGLFTSGATGPDSPGQGLGLAIARRLMSERGGSLELLDCPEPGATFVARLPVSEMSDAAPHHVA